MTTNEYLANTFGNGLKHGWLRKKVKCKDGFEISIQASAFHYCNPRETFSGPYNEVELGFPNMADETIIEYAEDPEYPTSTVYGYVPVEIVDILLEKHGGIID